MFLLRTLPRVFPRASYSAQEQFTQPFISRSFLHSQPLFRPPALHSNFQTFKNAFRNQTQQKRLITLEPAVGYGRPDSQTTIRKLVKAGALFGGTLFVTNLLFNRQSPEGALPEFERHYLRETFLYTGVGVATIGLVAKLAHNNGWSYRLMAANPWAVLGVSLAATLGTMFATLYTPPEKKFQKHLFWTTFNVSQAIVIAPLFFYSPALLARAGLYTMGVMGSLAFVGATAKQDQFLWLGGPLLAGVAVVCLSSLAPMALPLGSRALAGAEALSLYGGLAVFAGFTLYDTQKIRQNAGFVNQGLMKKDTVNEAIRLELDFLNIFVRLVQILANREQRRR